MQHQTLLLQHIYDQTRLTTQHAYSGGTTQAGSLLYGNNVITGAVIPSSNAIGVHFYPVWESLGFDEWLYNGGIVHETNVSQRVV